MTDFSSDRRSILSIGSAAMLAGLLPTLAHAQASDAGNDNKAKVQGVLTAWSQGTNDALFGIFSEDIQWTIVGHSAISGTYKGKAELTAKVNMPFAARFAKSPEKFRPVRIHGAYGDGDTVVALFDGRGIANDGKEYANSYAWFLHFKDGLVVDATAFYDSVAFNGLWRRVPVAG